MSKEVKLRVLKVDQPLGSFYVGAIDSRELNKISYTEIRKFEEGSQTKLAGIQRNRNAARVNELRKYVNYGFATFPTSIVLAIDLNSIKIEEIIKKDGNIEFNISEETDLYDLVITDYKADSDDPDDKDIPLGESAFIIDGQHRLIGLEGLNKGANFEVNVSIFVGIDTADKAEIFRIVNLSQNKVNKSLSYDLFEFANEKSPYKFAHDLVVALNEDDQGPFFQKIKRLGTATPGLEKKETLAQATIVQSIIKYITNDPDKERDKFFKDKSLMLNDSINEDVYIFAQFYHSDNQAGLFLLLSNYFTAVSKTWTDAWIDTEEGKILNRTTGFNALMRFLRVAYPKLKDSNGSVTEKSFYDLFSSMNIPEKELDRETYLPGSAGSSRLFKRFMDSANF